MVQPNSGHCFRCGERGHWADHCELNIPATTRAEHEGRIAAFVEKWINGEILTHQKRHLIEQENAMWNSVKPKTQKTGANAK
jgi:hypothetical protein